MPQIKFIAFHQFQAQKKCNILQIICINISVYSIDCITFAGVKNPYKIGDFYSILQPYFFVTISFVCVHSLNSRLIFFQKIVFFLFQYQKQLHIKIWHFHSILQQFERTMQIIYL